MNVSERSNKAKCFVFDGGKSRDQLTATREDILPLNICLESPDDFKVIIAESTKFKAVTAAGVVRKPVHDVEETIEPLLPSGASVKRQKHVLNTAPDMTTTPRVERVKETRACANNVRFVTFVTLEGSQKKSLPESGRSWQRFSALLDDVFYEVPFSVYVSNPVCVHSRVTYLVSFWFLLTVFRFHGCRCHGSFCFSISYSWRVQCICTPSSPSISNPCTITPLAFEYVCHALYTVTAL